MSNMCHHCGAEVRVRKRQFSQKAWTALIGWGEVRFENMDKAICQDCYIELREILIERTHEMEEMDKMEKVAR